MKIQVILASTRPGRVGERVARWVTNVAAENPDFQVELVDLADYDIPHFDEPISPRFNSSRQPNEPAKRWLGKVEEADGYVIVTPEYNHSFPGVLKNAIDYADWQFVKKPVAIVSYGTVGGARAAEQLKLVMIEAKAAIVPEAVAIIGAQGMIDEQGSFVGDTSNPYNAQANLRRVLGELAWWTETLKSGRGVKAAAR
jgi:NAD(P)H-dependent FMN reductase